METFELHPQTPQKRFIDKAVSTLKDGGVIIYPTDTSYGFGCSIYQKAAIERIMRIKGDEGEKLFSFIIPNFKEIARYAKVSDNNFRIMKRLLPGAYTFILPAAKEVPKKLWSKRSTVGIRIPNHAVAMTLANELGHPITGISVTDESGETLYNPDLIEEMFDKRVDLMLAAGTLEGKQSSVVDLSGETPEILRVGAGDISFFD